MGDQDITIGIPLPTSAAEGCQLDLSSVGATAEWAEAAGFDIVWCIDHLFHARQMLESMTTLSYVAGRTRRIKIGTAVYLLALAVHRHGKLATFDRSIPRNAVIRAAAAHIEPLAPLTSSS